MFRQKQNALYLACLLALGLVTTSSQAENMTRAKRSHNNASSFNNNASDPHVYQYRGKSAGALSSHSNRTHQSTRQSPRSYGNNADDLHHYKQRDHSVRRDTYSSKGHRGQHHSYGISGHPSFGLTPKPRHNKPHRYDHRPYHGDDHKLYQPPRGLSYRGVNGIIFYSATGYAVSNSASDSLIIRNDTANNYRSNTRSGLTQSDAWDALSHYEIDTARYAFESLMQSQPNAALPRVGFALSTALSGNVETGAYIMEEALLSDIDDLRYFKADPDLELIIEELLLSYQTDPLMTASLHYFSQNYKAANQAVSIAASRCQQCTAVINLKALIHQHI